MISALPLSDKVRKLVRSLHLRKYRDAKKLFIAEGIILVEELSRSSFKARLIIVRSDLYDELQPLLLKFTLQDIPLYVSTESDFGSLSDTQSPQGILAVVEYQDHDQPLSGQIVALDGVQDPGNVGTIIRTAHFFGFRTILLSSNCADKYNTKVVRATMGSLFHCDVFETDLSETLSSLQRSHDILGASAHATLRIGQWSADRPVCVVIGSEAQGISDKVLNVLSSSFTIPGLGDTKSLNASVAAGICLYHFSQYSAA